MASAESVSFSADTEGKAESVEKTEAVDVPSASVEQGTPNLAPASSAGASSAKDDEKPKDFKAVVKTDLSKLAMPASSLTPAEREVLRLKVLRQIEFYFCDANWPKDKFLQEKAAAHPEGLVEIEAIAAFPRMKKMTHDLEFITDVIKGSDQLTVSADSKFIKRAFPLQDADPAAPRQVFVRALPQDVTVEDIKKLFGSFGTVESVQMRRRAQDRTFKGSVFVTFDTEEAAQKAIAEPPSYLQQTLTVLSKQEFLAKAKEQGRTSPAPPKPEDLKKATAGAAAVATNGDAADENGDEGADEAGAGDGDAEAAAVRELTFDRVFKPKAVLTFEIDDPTNILFGALKDFFAKYGRVSFVEYAVGEKSGNVRFREVNAAEEAKKQIEEAGAVVGGQVLKLKLLEGEEEKAFWERALETMKKKPPPGDHFKRFGGKRRGGGRGGGFGGRRGGGRGGGGWRSKRQRSS